MENSELPTGPSADASPEERLTALLSADDAPKEASKPQIEVDADAPATEPEQDGAGDEEGETPEYQLADVAAMLGADASMLDVDADGAIMVKTKIDGVEGKAKFSDLIKSYQLQGHVDKQVREAAEMRKAVQEQAQALQQQTQIQQAVIGKLAQIKSVEAEYANYQNINLDALIDSDPVQALKIQQRMRVLEGQHSALQSEAKQAVDQIQQHQQQSHAATLETERQALLNAVPEWKDDAVASRDKQAIADDLKARGYSERDIQGLSDHKAVLLARDAMLYRMGKTANAAIEKQVRAAPKIVKPGSTQSANRMNAVQKLHAEVRNTGSRESVERWLLATGKV